MQSRPPLSGIRVLELADGWAGPLCGKLLSDLGAAVIKVENPSGDRVRTFGQSKHQGNLAFHLVNATKYACTSSQAIDVDFLSNIDVLLVDDVVPPRIGFDLAALSSSTVVCRTTSFGVDGPLSGMPANDLTLQAISGMMSTTGEMSGGPLRSGTEMSAVIAALYCTIGTIAALIERLTSSRGQTVEVSHYECLVSTLTHFAGRILAGHKPLGRLGNQGPNSAPWNLFESKDGEHVFIIAGNDAIFERLCNEMGQPELVKDPRFLTNSDRRTSYEAINKIVAEWTSQVDVAEIVARLQAAGVPVSLVANLNQLLDSEHFHFLNLLRDLDGETERVTTSGSPLGFVATQSHTIWKESHLSLDNLVVPDTSTHSLTAASDSASRIGPLATVKVLDVGSLTAGPLCCRLLANMGADVIKVEPPGGDHGRHSSPIVDGESIFFHITNNDKRSVALDLRDPKGRDQLVALAAQSHVLVENQSPGALARLGLPTDVLLSHNPNLIYASVTGFGSDGPLGGLRAYDTVVQAGAGLMSLTGEEGGDPLKTGISAADLVGALCCTAATVGAIYGNRTGRHAGTVLDITLYGSLAWATQMTWPLILDGKESPARHGNGHWCHAPYGVYSSGDNLVAIACETDDEWTSLFDVMNHLSPGLSEELRDLDHETRYEHRNHLNALVAAFCAKEDINEILESCARAGVPAAKVTDVGESIFSEQSQLHDAVLELELPNGKMVKVMNFPIQFSRTPAAVNRCAPMLGEHNEEILGPLLLGTPPQ